METMLMAATAPNERLRAVRRSLHMSQADLAKAIQAAGKRAGQPNSCTQQQVQRWERGDTRTPQPHYLRALEMVTGQPAENLGFATERYGVDVEALGGLPSLEAEPQTETAPLNGIWLSRYEYESSGRGATYSSSHYMLVVQRGATVQVRSLSKTAPGRVLMDLAINGQVLTGNWTEETNPNGYYMGAVYHGAIQMLLEPTGRKMAGKWAGFGRDFDVNTGPWSLELVTHDTSPEAQEEYNRPVEGSQ